MIGAIASDSYVPSLPTITKEFEADSQIMGLTLQLNWSIKAFSMLGIGFLSDKVGRRPAVIFAFTVFIIATCGCANSQNQYELLGFRILQGLGESTAVLAAAITRDVFDNPKQRQRIMSILGLLRPLAIIVGPTFGG